MTGVIIRREERAPMNTKERWPHDNRGRDWHFEVAKQGMPRMA